MRDIFTYGTLSLPHVMEALTGERFKFESAVAKGYDRFLLKGQIYPGLVASEGAVSDGKVYYDIDDDSFRLLERFEDDAYEAQEIDVVTDKGKALIVTAFVIPPEHADCLSDTPWDPTHFEEHHVQDYAAMCRQFFKRNG